MFATSHNTQDTEKAPSFEDARKIHKRIEFSHDASLLYWALSGPITKAISIKDNAHYDPDFPLQPYCLQTEPSLKWASIAQSPLTEPKISSVTVLVDPLYEWEERWMEMHARHAFPDEDHEESWVKFGTLVDFDPDSDEEEVEEGKGHMLRCCGGDRPRKPGVSLSVYATGEFLTVHDYVSAVHPWLMDLREKILQASGDIQDHIPLPSVTRLIVGSLSSPDFLTIDEEEQWQKRFSKKAMAKQAERLKSWEKWKEETDDWEPWYTEQGQRERGW